MSDVDLTQALVNFDDSVAKDPDGSIITLGGALKRAILADVDGDGNQVKGDDKVKRYDLFIKIKLAEKGLIKFEPEETILLNKAVLVFSIFTAGQIRSILKG